MNCVYCAAALKGFADSTIVEVVTHFTPSGKPKVGRAPACRDSDACHARRRAAELGIKFEEYYREA